MLSGVEVSRPHPSPAYSFTHSLHTGLVPDAGTPDTTEPLVQKPSGAPTTRWAWHSRPAYGMLQGSHASLPSPPFLSCPLLFVLSGIPIRLLPPVHTLPFLPGPVPGPLPGSLAPSPRSGLSPYHPTFGPEWSLGVSPLWPFMDTPCILGHPTQVWETHSSQDNTGPWWML